MCGVHSAPRMCPVFALERARFLIVLRTELQERCVSLMCYEKKRWRCRTGPARRQDRGELLSSNSLGGKRQSERPFGENGVFSFPFLFNCTHSLLLTVHAAQRELPFWRTSSCTSSSLRSSEEEEEEETLPLLLSERESEKSLSICFLEEQEKRKKKKCVRE